MERFTDFWNWFLEQEERLYYLLEEDPETVVTDITKQLKEIDPDLAFEIPYPIHHNKRNFIVSADGIFELFQTVIDMVECAPICRYFDVIAFRQPGDLIDGSITLEGIELHYDQIYFQYSNPSLPLELKVYIEGLDIQDHRFVHAYFLLLDNLIGEYDAVTLIEYTTFYPLDGQTQLFPITHLKDLIEDLQISN